MTNTLFFFESMTPVAPQYPSVIKYFNYPFEDKELRVKVTGDYGDFKGTPAYNICIDHIKLDEQKIYWPEKELNPTGVVAQILPDVRESAKHLIVTEFQNRLNKAA